MEPPCTSPRHWGMLLCWLSACAASEGPLLVRRSSADAGPAALQASSLQYQLTGDLDEQVDAQLFVVDLFATSAEQVAALHAAGRVVTAYVSVGSLESWRD